MSEISKSGGLCTQITTVKLSPNNQDEILRLMIERARFMATQPGFVSVNLHRSKDGSHIVNYLQWANLETLAAAHHSPEFRKQWPRFGELVEGIEPYLYDVVHIATDEKPGQKSGGGEPTGRDGAINYALTMETTDESDRHEDHIYRVIELVGSSSQSIEDAINEAVGRAHKTVRNLRWFEVVRTSGHIEQGKVKHYQVTLKVGLTMEDA